MDNLTKTNAYSVMLMYISIFYANYTSTFEISSNAYRHVGSHGWWLICDWGTCCWAGCGWWGCGWRSGWRGNGTCCWGNDICIQSLSHDMILDVALNMQNLHIHFIHCFHQTPKIYSKYVHILHIYTQNWMGILFIHLQKTFACTYCFTSRWT